MIVSLGSDSDTSQSEEDDDDRTNMFGLFRHKSKRLLPPDYCTQICNTVEVTPKIIQRKDKFIIVKLSKLSELLPSNCPLCGVVIKQWITVGLFSLHVRFC